MKTRIAAIALIALCPIGCTQREANQQQIKAKEQFDSAFDHLQYAASNTRADKRTADSPMIEEAEQKQLEAAAAQVQPLTSSAAGGKQVAARSLIAESLASKGRILARQAATAWTNQLPASSELIDEVMSIRTAAVISQAQGQVNLDKYIADLNEQLQKNTAEHDQLATKVADQQKSVEQLRMQMRQATDQQKAKSAQADDLSRKAFTAKGQAQYDLYTQAAEVTGEADKLTAAADTATAKLSVEQDELRVLSKQLEHSEQLIKDTQDAIANAQARAKQAHELTQTSQSNGDKLTQKFNDDLKKFVTRQSDEITKRYADAADTYSKAINTLEAAKGVAPADLRTAVDLNIASLRAEMGQTLVQQELVHQAYVSTLKELATATQGSASELNQQITQAVTAASERDGKAAKAATDALTTSLEALNTIAGNGDKPAQKVAYEQLAHVNNSLALLTGNDQYKSAAQKAMNAAQKIETP